MPHARWPISPISAATAWRCARSPDRALLALQGPRAAAVLERLAPGVSGLAFMSGAPFTIAGLACLVSRSGYTGEDGFEISVPADGAEALARRLLAEPEVKPVGLGARDTLRLEAGLCLYGHDIDETTTPVEADLTWTIAKRRRQEGGYPGAEIVTRELAARRRSQARRHPPGRARAGARGRRSSSPETAARSATSPAAASGRPSGGPIAMGYVASAYAAPGTEVGLGRARHAAPGARRRRCRSSRNRYHRG